MFSNAMDETEILKAYLWIMEYIFLDIDSW